jgi:hypothetical protein
VPWKNEDPIEYSLEFSSSAYRRWREILPTRNQELPRTATKAVGSLGTCLLVRLLSAWGVHGPFGLHLLRVANACWPGQWPPHAAACACMLILFYIYFKYIFLLKYVNVYPSFFFNECISIVIGSARTLYEWKCYVCLLFFLHSTFILWSHIITKTCGTG